MEQLNTYIKSTVAMVRCETYDETAVSNAVARGIGLLDAAPSLFVSGERIVLKPNVLVAVKPEHAATTHPSVMEGVVKVLQSHGVKLSYGDSPGFGKPLNAMKLSGLAAVAEKYGVPLADFEQGERVTHANALFQKTFPLARGVIEADGLVSVAKFKSHGLVRFTGAVKNQFGCVPGLHKARFHAQIPLITDFSMFLVDINTYIKPRLYILDAIIAMEGNGPNSGDPKKLGWLLFSTDPVALDATACRMAGLNPEYVPTNKAGQKAGLGTHRKENIALVGDTVTMPVDPSFKVVRLPAMSISRSGRLAGVQSLLLPKPVIDNTKCTKCGRCADTCPVEPKALVRVPGGEKLQPPQYTYSRCIRCFCCQEICPSKAIYIKTPFFRVLLPIFTMGTVGMSGLQFIVRHAGKRMFNGMFGKKQGKQK